MAAMAVGDATSAERQTHRLPMLQQSSSSPSFGSTWPAGRSPKRSGTEAQTSASRTLSSSGAASMKAFTASRQDVSSVSWPTSTGTHVPWKQLHISVKSGTRKLADRLADRERDGENEEFWSPLNLSQTRDGASKGLGASLRRARGSQPRFDTMSPRVIDMLKQTEEVQRLFSPAPLEDARQLRMKSTKGSSSPVGTKPTGKTLKPSVRSSLTITKGCRLAQLIESGCIGLVRSSYFEDCMLHNRPLSMRQWIPNSFMWRGDEAVNLWWKHGKCFLIVVSYSWLSRDHPDPDQVHLRKLVRILEEYKKIWNMHEVGVIVDYCSLWQRGARVDTRTSEQKEQFNHGLRELNVAYAHKAITAVKLTEVPASEPRKYEDRGWTLMEEILIDSKGGDWNRWSFGEFDPESSQWADSVVFFLQAKPLKLRPPLTPQKFLHELELRRHRARCSEVPLFYNEKDNEDVPKLYEDIYAQLIHSTKLSYGNAGWSDEEALYLLEVVANCDRLEKLNLASNRISLQGASEVAKLIPQLPTLKHLDLGGNPLCRDSQATDLLRLVWSREKKPARNLLL